MNLSTLAAMSPGSSACYWAESVKKIDDQASCLLRSEPSSMPTTLFNKPAPFGEGGYFGH